MLGYVQKDTDQGATLTSGGKAPTGDESGMVSVNEFFITFPQTPFMGWKHLPIGAEQGRVALDFYTRVKNVNVNLG